MSPLTRHPVTFQGSRLARWTLKMLGWRLDFEGFPARQGVAIVYPHTSNWDFPIGMLAKWALGVPARFWGKDSLFKLPVIGAWMRWVGGIPIDRSSSRGVVGQMVHVFDQYKQNDQLLWLGLAPEGTRSFTPGWRSGFYQLALGAQVPLALVKLDWGQRRFSVVDFYDLTGQVERDYAHMAQVFEGVKGFHEHQMGPILPWSPGQADESARLKR
ncbi:1-acyl-sn-glycerol-3-phosphate acyltransferase [Limnohabitans sp.]|uniref:1-acyl-sn-glycerol-3-phosphate acyltransferase n=1 Tax=Limnohabitans sp. TaxID=1907725 RepID=UPI0025C08A2A|nr:1-acyl-sn-glycerol-3-phosphate acyltransferase [Limnohabitans sp.]